MAIHIGCGSWRDDEYVGVLYPKKLPEKRRLAFYTKWFDRVELNATYHALPKREHVQAWEAQTPAGFFFDVKLPRGFSDDPSAAAQSGLCERMHEMIGPFVEAKKFGVFLLTLSPSFTTKKHSLEELDEVVEKLRPHRIAVEFRNREWVDGKRLAEALEYFRSRQLVWVALDLPRIDSPKLLPAIDEVTHPDVAYMRLHGRNPDYLLGENAKDKHRYAYTERDLKEIAARIQKLATKAKDVHVSVNNHAEDFAPKAAIALRRILGQPVLPGIPEIPDGGDQGSLF
ncbi:DUF72 domain-containing protein [Nibricoccus aquaticus]|nr:DUF72 domain-containing protein [Nibricoccus aquaticus]